MLQMSADDFKEWPMDLSPVQVDDDGRLFISPVIHNWNIVTERGIHTHPLEEALARAVQEAERERDADSS